MPDARLVVIGDGPARRDLRAARRRAARRDLVGARSDIRAWLAAADVVVVPSRWDGMSLVPLEAMACARSVVATSVSGVAESVPDDAGAIVVPDDHAAMAAAVVERLLDPNLAADEGWVGRAHVEAHHDVAASAHELARIYLRLVGERRSHCRGTGNR